MLSLPESIMSIFHPFSQLFSKRVWPRARMLWSGALLCPRQRTVASVLRVLGLAHISNFCSWHRVLSHARWSALKAARILLSLIVEHIPDREPLFIGVDELIERRYGKRVPAKGIYYDAARSFPERQAFSLGLQWIVMMVIVRVPFNKRRWALPFFTVLAAPERHSRNQGKRHKTILDIASQMMLCVRRWLGDRPVYLLGDGTYASVAFAHTCRRNDWHLVSRLRLDARLHNFVPDVWKKPGKKPKKGQRLPSLKERLEDKQSPWSVLTFQGYQQQKRRMQYLYGTCLWYRNGVDPLPIRWLLTKDAGGSASAIFTTDLSLTPRQMIEYYYLRWNVEVTFEESRAHLGIGTQRQWSPKAIQRTTPALLALFSVATLAALEVDNRQNIRPQSTVWYRKEQLTFSDVLTELRTRIWNHNYIEHSTSAPGVIELKHDQWQNLIYQLARAA